MTRFTIAQGDVLVRSIDKLPDNVVPVPAQNGRAVLAYGEATGHHHSVLANRATLFREDGSGSGLFMQISAGPAVALEHQEHTTIEIPAGNYEIVQQRTYHAGMARRVVD